MIDDRARAVSTDAVPWWSRALAEGDRGRAGRPAWAAFVDDTLAGWPASVPLPAELPGLTGFAALLAPFAEAAAAGLPGELPGAGAAAIRAAHAARLADALARCAARTLVLELDAAREAGALIGDTPSDRFRDFVQLLSNRASMTALCYAYPVLARLIGQRCLHTTAALAELLGRFAADRAELVATLLGGADPGPLAAVETGAGDGHQHGRAVAILRFADGRSAVYKPRPPAMHRHFNEVVRWFAALPGVPDLSAPAVLDRGDYGWVEHVPAHPCATDGELDRFYRRLGALLALAHALGATDLHYENLIARGEHPLLIDVETLFHPGAVPAGVEDPAVAALGASVQRTGLLPILLLGDRSAMDASGLGGDPGAPLPVDRAVWADPGTDRMRLVRRPGTAAGGGNRPGPAEPAAHADALLAGFRAGHRAVAAHRDALLGPSGLLRRFADDPARVVLRATRAYATLAEEATHPEALRDAAARAALFDLLDSQDLGGPAHPAVREHEAAQLWDDDIPVFGTRPGSRDLWSGTGERIPGFLARSGLDVAGDRIRAMDEADCRAQEWIVRAALAARSTTPPHGPSTPPHRPVPVGGPSGAAAPAAPDPDRLLAAARGIGDRLLALAHRAPGRANWLGLELLGGRYWQLRPCGADLACGYPGVALFLAQLAALTGAEQYAAAARTALRPLPVLLERLAARPADAAAVGPGAFAGLGGIAWAAAATAAALDDPELRALVAPATALTVLSATWADGPSDGSSGPAGAPVAGAAEGLAEGLAGGAAALLAVHRATGAAEARRGALACAARLVARPLPSRAGLLHGAAGIGWALLGCAAAGGGRRYEQAGLAALRTAADRARGSSWCEGPAGVALAVADRPAAAADPDLAAAAARAGRELARSAPAADHSLCHGELGLLEAAAPLPGPLAAAARHRRTGRLLAALERGEPVCGTPGGLAVPGLLTGLAGLGHGLLRQGFADRTASVLLLRTEPDCASPAARRDVRGEEGNHHGDSRPGPFLEAAAADPVRRPRG
ncbi:type 2 lanthipeptide synthetase LanM family protein [Kitasatospora sp. NPDC058965]|uniref:type 2 lanthipeptide synthetase LanM family protein n=1 Tax=Kitasatospora sp. NPDC058965 TaxID=3346682 RepID=UPI0036A9EE33